MASKLRPIWVDDTQRLLPKNERKTTNRSELAKKFGHPFGTIDGLSQGILKNTGKSGNTPISVFMPGSVRHKEVLTSYQKRRFLGFSALELQALDAMAALQTQGMNGSLNNPISPLYSLSQWETEAQMPKNLGPLPIRGDYDSGLWLAENPIVWKIMQPSLQLASLFIENAHFSPWWDALINGDIINIPDWRDPREAEAKKDPLLNFNYRNPWLSQTQSAIDGIRQMFKDLQKSLKFRLTTGYSMSSAGLPIFESPFAGYEKEILLTQLFMISIGIEVLQPLLDDTLTPAERIAVQFRFASTIIHETAHAVWNLRVYSRVPKYPIDAEPYFGDEVLAELGWSLEDKIFGGEGMEIVPVGYLQGGPGISHMGIIKTNWFNYRHTNYMDGTIPLLEYATPLPDAVQDPFYCNDFWPISTSWSHGLFQMDLWEMFVRGYGAEAMQMGPCVWGTRIWQDDPYESPARFLMGADLQNCSNPPQYSTNFTPLQHAQYVLEERRRKRTEDINSNFYRTDSSLTLPPVPDDYENINPSTDRHQILDFLCPRWDEITTYLFTNRGPLELALETITFSIPEPTLHAYIRARGGLSLTPAEFRQFLRTADHRQLLFSYLPLPGTGTVRRLPYGWPTPYQPPEIPQMAFVTNMNNYYDVDVLLRTHDELQATLYKEYGEFRDMDLHVLRNVVNIYIPDPGKVSETEWLLVVNRLAIEGRVLTWGPRGVVRLLVPIEEAHRQKWKTKMMDLMEEILREKEREARETDSWRIVSLAG